MSRIALDWFVNPDHVPLYAAGLAPDLLVPGDPDEPLRALVEGRADIALNYQPNITIARSKGTPIRAVAALIDQVLDTLMVPADAPVRSIGDLKGKRVAYAVEPFDRVMFQAIARHAGLADGAWRFVDVGFEFTRALLDGRVDAVMGAFRNYEVIEAEELGMPVRTFELADHGIPPFDQLVFVVRDSDEHRPEISATLARIARGVVATRDDPDGAYRAYLAANPRHDDRFHRRVFDATLPLFARTPRLDPERWRVFARFLHERGLVERAPDAHELVTSEFAA